MVYRFLIVSNEVEDFMREIEADAGSTFLQLHKAILESCGYDDEEMTSFTICDEGWEKGQEITLEEMDTYSDEDSYVMATTRLSEFLLDEEQLMIYTFDMMAERMFFIKLAKISTGNLKEPRLTRSQGGAPPQRLDFDQLMNLNPINPTADNGDFIDDDMTSDDFNDEDIEIGGLDISDDPFS